MTSKLAPSNPSDVMVIRKITDSITTLSLPFARFGLIKIGGRGTLVRLQDGTVAVFSPVALTPEVKQTVSNMGEVKYIVAPDLEHHIFLGPWSAAYPSASLLAPHGLAEKRAKQKDEAVSLTHVYTPSNKSSLSVSAAFDAEFEVEYVDGHVNRELVFLHKPSRTLIEADLLFNLPATEQYSRVPGADATSGVFTKVWAWMNNTRGEAMAQRRFIWYATSGGDRDSFGKSVRRIQGWGFDRIVPCHGEVIEEGGKGVFERVMAWHLEGKKNS